MSPEDRDIPISLRGIENILRVLQNTLKEPSSIRQISVEADLSLRVTKNILMELENLKQVQQIVEMGQVVPKWQLTDLGIKIAKAIEQPVTQTAKNSQEFLLENVVIPKKIEDMNDQIGNSHRSLMQALKNIQLSFSKALGVCYSNDQPGMAETLGIWITKVKDIHRQFGEYRSNPLAYFNLKKKNSSNSLSNKQKRALFAQILFVNEILHNLIMQLGQEGMTIANMIDQYSSQQTVNFNIFAPFRPHHEKIFNYLGTLTHFIQKRTTLEENYDIFSEEDRRRLLKNQISMDLLNQLLPIAPDNDKIQNIIQEELIKFINQYYPKGGSPLAFIPLISFIAQFKEAIGWFNLTAEEVEEALHTLQQQELIVGVKTIQDGGIDTYKIVQFTTEDLMAEELRLLRFALENKSFTKLQIMENFAWDQLKTQNILTILTENGLLRHSKSYLHGEKWYLVA